MHNSKWLPLHSLLYALIGVHMDYILILGWKLNYKGLLADHESIAVRWGHTK